MWGRYFAVACSNHLWHHHFPGHANQSYAGWPTPEPHLQDAPRNQEEPYPVGHLLSHTRQAVPPGPLPARSRKVWSFTFPTERKLQSLHHVLKVKVTNYYRCVCSCLLKRNVIYVFFWFVFWWGRYFVASFGFMKNVGAGVDRKQKNKTK